MKQIIFIATLCLLAFPAQARPISYPGGWTLMLMNDTDINSLHLHYSPAADYSIGLRHEYLRGPDANVDTLTLNYLIHRWNMPAAQANLYIKSGAGIAYNEGEYDPAAYTGFAGDWENRRFFTSYENRFFWADDTDRFIAHKARIGIAPYIGDYGDIHTWLMLQTDYDAGKNDNFSLTPLVRLFKGPTMIEAGYNLDGGALFNFIYRF